MARRREKTLADYVVIAISPALIMTLVGSLVYFLLELIYKGEHEIRMQWVLFWFVIGSVLVARIGIEEGKERAALFSGTLGVATAFVAMRLVDAFLVVWVLLAVIAWCSWKLTWDCTLIDDGEDASGEGLLQAAGLATSERSSDTLARSASEGARQSASETPSLARRASRTDSQSVRVVVNPDDHESTSPDGRIEYPPSESDDSRGKKSRRPHAPGRWVVYFSLAALPLFGVGQALIPAAEAGRRSYAFKLLAVYVASGLGLLLTTSFLGLRRYLRQRKLQMPAAMTGTWLGMGATLAIVLLIAAMLIPRPQGEYTLTALVDQLDSKVRDASKFAVLGGDRGKGEGRRIGQQDQKAGQPGEGQPRDKNAKQNNQQNGGDKQPGDKDGKDGQARDENQRDANDRDKNQDAQSEKDKAQGGGKGQAPRPGQGQGQGGRKGEQNQGQAADKARQQNDQQRAGGPQRDNMEKGGKPRGNNAPPPPQSDSSPTSFLAQLAPFVKWIIYGALALVSVYLLIRHGSQLADLLAKLWAELLSLFGLRSAATAAAAADDGEPEAPAPPRPFAAFEDPFFSGAARKMSPSQLVRYTFDALEAWSREQGISRPPDQTPLEFAQELSRRRPALAKDVTQTAQLYAGVAYARTSPSRDSVEVLERVWRKMSLGAGVEVA